MENLGIFRGNVPVVCRDWTASIHSHRADMSLGIGPNLDLGCCSAVCVDVKGSVWYDSFAI